MLINSVHPSGAMVDPVISQLTGPVKNRLISPVAKSHANI
jgi:hypothetical protein